MNFFVREDSLYESLSPLYLAVSAIMFGLAFYRSRGRLGFNAAGLQRLSFLGLAGTFLAATFEEISWGQRIFNFATPNFMEDANAQKEFTFHNLKFFQGDDAVLPLDFDQLAAIFALTMGLLIPVACAVIPALGAFVHPRFPVLPIQFSVLFAMNYGLQKLAVRFLPLFPELYHNTTRKMPAVVHEIREHNYGLLLMISIAFFFVLRAEMTSVEARLIPARRDEEKLLPAKDQES